MVRGWGEGFPRHSLKIQNTKKRRCGSEGSRTGTRANVRVHTVLSASLGAWRRHPKTLRHVTVSTASDVGVLLLQHQAPQTRKHAHTHRNCPLEGSARLSDCVSFCATRRLQGNTNIIVCRFERPLHPIDSPYFKYDNNIHGNVIAPKRLRGSWLCYSSSSIISINIVVVDLGTDDTPYEACVCLAFAMRKRSPSMRVTWRG